MHPGRATPRPPSTCPGLPTPQGTVREGRVLAPSLTFQRDGVQGAPPWEAGLWHSSGWTDGASKDCRRLCTQTNFPRAPAERGPAPGPTPHLPVPTPASRALTPRRGCCPEQGKRGRFRARLSNNPSSENSTLSQQDEAPNLCPALHPYSLNLEYRNSSVDQNMRLDLKTRGLRRTARPLKPAGPVGSHGASRRPGLSQRCSELPLSPRRL